MKFIHSTSWLEISPAEQAPLKRADEVHSLDFMTRKFTFSSSMVAAHPSQGVGKPWESTLDLAFAWYAVGHGAPVKNLQQGKLRTNQTW